MLCDYLITTKKNDGRFADQVSALLYVFAVIIFSYTYYSLPVKDPFFIFVISGLIASYIYVLYKKRKDGRAFYRFGLIIAAVGWFRINIFMGILYAVAALLESQVKFPHEICFAKEGITFNTFPKKKIGWNEVVNVKMKDGLITIDQKNNKLYQKEIEGEVTAEEESEFNSYCRSYIETFHVD